ncbi:hypothetical protein D5018_12195 [Parashewanella curva]|uniref:Uncharacterized protein n=1 Tax=Parashewanella curva TaxID=2338552 RepID=A0A3L8PZD9_9GAMM|nr:hypothetical protein [Parashewanella curva]RLV59452.1 hypothetical protein D5018_12195 [Parashewanella curva]
MSKLLFYFIMAIGFVSITGYNFGYFVFNPNHPTSDWIDITKAVFSVLGAGYFLNRLRNYLQQQQN